MSDDHSVASHPGSARGSRTLQEEPLDVILSPELDKMVSDGESLCFRNLLSYLVFIYSILHIRCELKFII